MTILQILVLALIQGITEFIPISSSGHLVLVRQMMHWSDEGGVLLDTVLHAGSLLAILVYFHHDWWSMLRALLRPARMTAEDRGHRKTLRMLILATLPVVLAGPYLYSRMADVRHGHIVGAVMLSCAFCFIFAEYWKRSRPPGIGWKTALAMGIAQIFALFPGASRSGLTTSTGVLCGKARTESARFAFMMAVPAILGAMVFQVFKLFDGSMDGLPLLPLLAGFAVCFLVSMACIHFLLRFFRRHTLSTFAVYLFAVGNLILALEIGF
ncbi:undecaprenyl-diphosphate phosphatase [Kiritimatiella glycovorans]|uniref:Undecaprenyl-diphosphatase n=1 Tax=Kiritimatiella glycovorans TaxID=1307763 RepID=A0A0G3EB77_9BACT|nr:undecaprenyl-diphosphate phosphatase [Kiritimatiella glycovorans]AKJ63751.1 Undecaprenyl-diphosphatase [Kiritimatiella glycovorans]